MSRDSKRDRLNRRKKAVPTLSDLSTPASSVSPRREATVKSPPQVIELDWIEWEIKQARLELDRAITGLERNYYVRQELSSALNHAVWAWTRAHSSRKSPNNQSNNDVFLDEAPAALIKLHMKAHSALTQLAVGFIAADTVMEAVSRMVEATLNAASRPSK